MDIKSPSLLSTNSKIIKNRKNSQEGEPARGEDYSQPRKTLVFQFRRRGCFNRGCGRGWEETLIQPCENTVVDWGRRVHNTDVIKCSTR